MFLHGYKIDLSPLSPDAMSELLKKIEKVSYNGFFWYANSLCGEFFIDENFPINHLKIPAQCNLTRL